MKKGIKSDEGKLRWDLLPMKPIESLVAVLTHGAAKYSPDNWQRVKPFKERYYAALMRHLAAWKEGESIDADSKLPHLSHAMCCILFLLWNELRGGE